MAHRSASSQAVASVARIVAIASLSLAAACRPAVYGWCSQDSDCPAGDICEGTPPFGTCTLPPDAGPSDGGSDAGPSDGGSDAGGPVIALTIDDSSAAPFSPNDRPSVQLFVRGDPSVDTRLDTLSVDLLGADGGLVAAYTHAFGGSVLDAGAQLTQQGTLDFVGLGQGAAPLSASLSYRAFDGGGALNASGEWSQSVDDIAPVATVQTYTAVAPMHSWPIAGGPSTTWFGNGDGGMIAIDVHLDDGAGAGVDGGTLVVGDNCQGICAFDGVPQGAGTYRFFVPGDVDGVLIATFGFTIVTSDLAGNIGGDAGVLGTFNIDNQAPDAGPSSIRGGVLSAGQLWCDGGATLEVDVPVSDGEGVGVDGNSLLLTAAQSDNTTRGVSGSLVSSGTGGQSATFSVPVSMATSGSVSMSGTLADLLGNRAAFEAGSVLVDALGPEIISSNVLVVDGGSCATGTVCSRGSSIAPGQYVVQRDDQIEVEFLADDGCSGTPGVGISDAGASCTLNGVTVPASAVATSVVDAGCPQLRFACSFDLGLVPFADTNDGDAAQTQAAGVSLTAQDQVGNVTVDPLAVTFSVARWRWHSDAGLPLGGPALLPLDAGAATLGAAPGRDVVLPLTAGNSRDAGVAMFSAAGDLSTDTLTDGGAYSDDVAPGPIAVSASGSIWVAGGSALCAAADCANRVWVIQNQEGSQQTVVCPAAAGVVSALAVTTHADGSELAAASLSSSSPAVQIFRLVDAGSAPSCQSFILLSAELGGATGVSFGGGSLFVAYDGGFYSDALDGGAFDEAQVLFVDPLNSYISLPAGVSVREEDGALNPFFIAYSDASLGELREAQRGISGSIGSTSVTVDGGSERFAGPFAAWSTASGANGATGAVGAGAVSAGAPAADSMRERLVRPDTGLGTEIWTPDVDWGDLDLGLAAAHTLDTSTPVFDENAVYTVSPQGELWRSPLPSGPSLEMLFSDGGATADLLVSAPVLLELPDGGTAVLLVTHTGLVEQIWLAEDGGTVVEQVLQVPSFDAGAPPTPVLDVWNGGSIVYLVDGAHELWSLLLDNRPLAASPSVWPRPGHDSCNSRNADADAGACP